MARKRAQQPQSTGDGRIVTFADVLPDVPTFTPGAVAPGNASPGPAVASVAPGAVTVSLAPPDRAAGPGAPLETARAAVATPPLADRVSQEFLAVVQATASALTRAVRAPLLTLAEAVARGDCQSDTPRWRELAGAVFQPLMAAADKTSGRGLATEDEARALCPPVARVGHATDPALVAAIMAHRASGASAVKIAKELAPKFNRRKLEPSWIRSVYVRRGDPAPAETRAADAARERKRLEAALARAREVGMIQ